MAPSLETLLALIEEPNQSRCRLIYERHRRRIDAAPGSSHNHQAWPGGYVGHLHELGLIAAKMYAALSEIRPLPFSLSDAALVLFLHDLEKPWHHVEPRTTFANEELEHRHVHRYVDAFGIELADEHRNAIRYIHGEGDDYRRDRRVMGPLAAFCHDCDLVSARIWPDHPKPAA